MLLSHDSRLIRKAEPSDLPKLQGIVDALGFNKDAGYFETCMERSAQGTLDIYIISEGEEDAGYCLVNWQPKYRYFQVIDAPEIQDLNVVSAHRRKGFASALIDHCEAVARNEGKTTMAISFGLTPDYGPAQRLYVKKGYIPDGNGVTYDRQILSHGDNAVMDDNLCLMLTKAL